MTQKEVFNWLIKGSMVLGLVLSAVLSGFFRTERAEASYLIEKKCLQSQSKKKSLDRRKQICACVVMNLQSRLTREQTKKLEKVYENRSKRFTASKDDAMKAILNLDHEVNKNCVLNPQWRLPEEDLGVADPL